MRIETRTIAIADDVDKKRLDVYLAEKFDKFSRSEWQKRIETGGINVNGIAARASRKLHAGDLVEFSYTMPNEPDVDTRIEVLYEDADYLIVNKPAGLPVHPSGIYKSRTVTTVLAESNVLRTPYLLHRLDRETSGVLALAKNREAAALFQKILRDHKIEKEYTVAIEGTFADSLNAEGFIYRLPHSRLARQRFFSAEKPPENAIETQTCRTFFSPLIRKNNLSLLSARLYTGRMHQIRATLCSLGYPIVGDKLYGVDASLYFKFADEILTDSEIAALRISRSALHCSKLSLLHPQKNTPWSIEAKLPGDIQHLFT